MKKYTFEIRLQNGQLYHKSDNVYDTLDEAKVACDCVLNDIMEYESIDLDGFMEEDFRLYYPEVNIIMEKYFWYSEDFGFSEEFSTMEECEVDAIKNFEENPGEYGIYSYDAEKFPDGDVEIDDCNYLSVVGLD